MADERHFGRLVAPDARDHAFPMRLTLDPLRETFFPSGIPAGSRHYKPGPLLNQRATGTCVAHGWAAKINAAPIMQKLSITPYDLYRRIVAVDEFAGNDGEAAAGDSGLQFGTSVRAGAKVMQAMGYLQQYLWAESVEDVRSWHLAGFGGCVIGVNWTQDMMETDGWGFLNYTGWVVGGHCVVTTGWSDKVRSGKGDVRAVRIQQSWALPWGQKGTGRAWISEADLAKLLADDGECCAASELKIVQPQLVSVRI